MMNKKITAKNKWDESVWCVIDGTKDMNDEIDRVVGGVPGHGIKASFNGDEILVENYFAGDVIARLPVLSVEDTDDEPFYYWKKA